MQCTSIHIHQRNDIILVDNNTAHVNAQRMQPLGPVLTRKLWIVEESPLSARLPCRLGELVVLVEQLSPASARRPYFCPYSCVVFFF